MQSSPGDALAEIGGDRPNHLEPSNLRASLMASSRRRWPVHRCNVMIFESFRWRLLGQNGSFGRDPQPQPKRDQGHGADATEPKGREPQQPLRQGTPTWL